MARTMGKRPPFPFIHKVKEVYHRRDIYAKDAESFVQWMLALDHVDIELYHPYCTVDGIIVSRPFVSPWTYRRKVEVKNIRYGDVVFPFDPAKPGQLPYCIEKNVLILFLCREAVEWVSGRWRYKYGLWWMDGSKLASCADVSILKTNVA